MLENITAPKNLKGLSKPQLKTLAEEIRAKIISTVSENGGHLASNLGDVELTLALHIAFDAPEDKIIFDVGHQCYAHKLITGRYNAFDTLRQQNGISGFTRRDESEYDTVSAGHASDAISLATGIARARDLNGQGFNVCAVLGDGALTGGMCYEALNDLGHKKTRLVIVLNDNEMSISKNVGAMSKHLTLMRQSGFYRSAKQRVRDFFSRLPKGGRMLTNLFRNFRDAVKKFVIDDTFFNSLDIEYLGPIDGHDIGSMVKVLKKTKEYDRPVVVHVVTQKGRGYKPAESSPEKFHGAAPFYIDSGKAKNSAELSCGGIAAEYIAELAKTDKSIACVSAAMLEGTGLKRFNDAYPERCFDVGIAEEHAMTLAAGLALGGMHPFLALYSTFLQRAYDQLIMNGALNHVGLTLLIDRAGLNGEDGETHQGIFDIALLNTVPDIFICSPSNQNQLKRLIDLSFKTDVPFAIRYPKRLPKGENIPIVLGKWIRLRSGQDAEIAASGRFVSVALKCAQMLKQRDINVGVADALFLKPLDTDFISGCVRSKVPVITIEDGIIAGGFGEAVKRSIETLGGTNRVLTLGVPDKFIKQAKVEEQIHALRLDAQSITDRIICFLNGGNSEETRR